MQKKRRFDPWVRKTPGGGHDNPFQYSCLENPMDIGAWWATVHRVAKSWTGLKQLSIVGTHTHWTNLFELAVTVVPHPDSWLSL